MREAIGAFVERVGREALPVEAVSVYAGDREVITHRFVKDTARNIYSHTKSFMATAVGMAIADGALSLTDRPVDFFPEAVGEETDAQAGDITLRDLLMMASGFDAPLLMMAERGNGIGAPDYARFVLGHPVKKTPGTSFCYSNGDSYLAGRMVEKRVGMTLRDYLYQRLFKPLDIPYPEWEHCPMGHTFGASGMKLRLHDMLKLGRLYLRQGNWNGRQLVDPAWVREATALQIGTPGVEAKPWHMGYGYQFWRSPYPGAYRADGAYGQITTVLPEADAVVAIQCAESDRSDSIRIALDEEVLSKIGREFEGIAP